MTSRENVLYSCIFAMGNSGLKLKMFQRDGERKQDKHVLSFCSFLLAM